MANYIYIACLSFCIIKSGFHVRMREYSFFRAACAEDVSKTLTQLNSWKISQ